MRRPLFRIWIIWTLVYLTCVQCSTLYQWIVDSQTRFNYDPDPNNMLGVYNWPQTYSSDCGGLHQSPVDIQLNQVRYGVSCRCPRLIYSSNYLSGTFKNNGHSAEFEPEDELMLQLTNVPYREGMYKMHDFHLHYGGVAGRDFELQGRRFRGSGIMSAGSEHTIDGLRFEGEKTLYIGTFTKPDLLTQVAWLHFVFYNSRYRDLEEADNKTDGIVVIVMLIQKLPMMMSGTMETLRFSDFLETNIPQIFPYQSNYTTEVDLTVFFNRSCEFYTYAGSTTTPTCHESVRWILMKDPLTVTERAWFQLTGLQSRGDFNARFGNYRTTQPLNDRVVEANFDRPSESVLPSATGESALVMMMMSVLMNMVNVTSQDMIDIMGANRIDVAMFPSVADNIRNMPVREMSRNALVPNLNSNLQERPVMSTNTFQTPVDNIRNMPLMVTNRDALVPILERNTRNMPMRPMTRDGLVSNQDGDTQNIPMRPMTRDGLVSNQDGDTRNMPMRPMTRDGLVSNQDGVTRNMPMRPMTRDGLVPNLNGNFIGLPSGRNIMNANRKVQNQMNPVVRQYIQGKTFSVNHRSNVGTALYQNNYMSVGNLGRRNGKPAMADFIQSMAPWVWR